MSSLATACDKVRARLALNSAEVQASARAALEKADEMEKEKEACKFITPHSIINARKTLGHIIPRYIEEI
jgi:hypothetical protein